MGSKKEHLIWRPHLAMSTSVALHLVLHLWLDFHESVHMSSLPNVVRTGLVTTMFNALNTKLNPICHLLALLGGHHILHVSRIRVKGLIEYPLVLSAFCTSLGEYWHRRSPIVIKQL